MMSDKKMFLSPDKLYPMTGINSIDPEILQQMVETMKAGGKVRPVKIMLFKGDYYILEGHYEMLAANVLKRELEAEAVNAEELSFWKDEDNILFQLQAVGMTALYDFEAVGGFRYKSYPPYYKSLLDGHSDSDGRDC